MKLKKWTIFLQIAALLLLIGQPRHAYACSCEDRGLDEVGRIKATLDERFYQAAFVGTVTDVYFDDPGDEFYFEVLVYVTFSVETVLKGELASEIVITTAADDGLCGVNFLPGRTYLTIVDENWHTGLCSGNVSEPSAELIANFETSPPSEDGARGVKIPPPVEPTATPEPTLPPTIEATPPPAPTLTPAPETIPDDATSSVPTSVIAVTSLGILLGMAVAWLKRGRS